eukprot:COSAG02_NODE_15709_length_1147_cov_0.985687_2_plen_161_part_01
MHAAPTKKILVIHIPGLCIVRKRVEQWLHWWRAVRSYVLRLYIIAHIEVDNLKTVPQDWTQSCSHLLHELLHCKIMSNHGKNWIHTSSRTYGLRLSRSSTILTSIGVVDSPNSQSSFLPPEAWPPGAVHSAPFSPQRGPTGGSGAIAGFERSPWVRKMGQK